MKTWKHFLLAAVFVLVSGLGAGVMAQIEMEVPPDAIEPITKLNAIEITDGTIGYESQTRQQKTSFGYGFLGQTTGAFPGSFTLSMNCTPPPQPLDGGSEVGGISISTTELTGGAWTLPVYNNGKYGAFYAGSLYGTVVTGTMTWDNTQTNATVYIVLRVDGGTQTWESVGGFATFAGTLSFDEKTQKKVLSGDLMFNIISAVVE
ncbi:MAG TPA: hypothetical protein VIF64_16135 [Pyrinomonadaceae bacterium]|jgi:hypothetical protein